MKTSVRFLLLILLAASCKKSNDATIPANTPTITGVYLYDINAQINGQIGVPDIMDSAIHSKGTNYLRFLPNPAHDFVSIIVYEKDTATVTIKVEAAYYPLHPDSIKVENDSLFGKRDLVNATWRAFPPSMVIDYMPDSLANGFYRIIAIIKTATYTDSLYENLWIKK